MTERKLQRCEDTCASRTTKLKFGGGGGLLCLLVEREEALVAREAVVLSERRNSGGLRKEMPSGHAARENAGAGHRNGNLWPC